MFFCNATAIITYFNEYPCAINFIKAGFDDPVLFAVFDGIINQVYKDLPDLFFIGEYS